MGQRQDWPSSKPRYNPFLPFVDDFAEFWEIESKWSEFDAPADYRFFRPSMARLFVFQFEYLDFASANAEKLAAWEATLPNELIEVRTKPPTGNREGLFFWDSIFPVATNVLEPFFAERDIQRWHFTGSLGPFDSPDDDYYGRARRELVRASWTMFAVGLINELNVASGSRLEASA